MKKLILILVVVFAFTQTKAADSTNVTLSIQGKDLMYLGAFICNNEFYDNLTDSIKAKFRGQANVTVNENVTVTGYVKDFRECLKLLKNDITAKNAKADERLRTVFLGSGNQDLIDYVNKTDISEQSSYKSIRDYGKFRLSRKK